MFYFLFFITITNFSLKALPLNDILKANNAVSLNQSIKKYNKKILLETLCEKQKSNKRIPTACYQLDLNADFWCLNLKLEDLIQLKNLKKDLESKFLSKKCKKHLIKQKKILIYRQKDFFLPELKNYFTVEKPFF